MCKWNYDLSQKAILGTVVILDVGIQDKQCRKIAGKLWAGNYPRNLIWDLINGISRETKRNTDKDIQYYPILMSVYKMTKNVEVSTYGHKVSWEWIYDNRAIGKCTNLGN